MAAGLSMEEEKIELLRKRLNELTELTEEDLIPKVKIDVPMPIDYISEQLIRELEYLEPFGKGNPKPLFAQKNLRVLEGRILGKNKNVMRMRVCSETGRQMDAVYFGDIQAFLAHLESSFGGAQLEKMLQGQLNKIVLTVTYYPVVHVFRDQKSIQIVIQNYQ